MTDDPNKDDAQSDEQDHFLNDETVLAEASEEEQSSHFSASELQKISEEMRVYRDKYFRALADGENLRKRLIKEKEDYCKHTVISTIADFLQPLDSLENALFHADKGSEEIKNWAIGFQMIVNQFKETLKQQGVKKIETVGLLFDPHFHEAVEAKETNEYPSGTILEEFTCGYTMGDRVVRPARVKVVREPIETQEDI